MAVAHYNCDYCNNMVYDEETEQFVCDVDMDEDDYARLLTSEYKECPYYPVSYTHLTLPTTSRV